MQLNAKRDNNDKPNKKRKKNRLVKTANFYQITIPCKCLKTYFRAISMNKFSEYMTHITRNGEKTLARFY